MKYYLESFNDKTKSCDKSFLKKDINGSQYRELDVFLLYFGEKFKYELSKEESYILKRHLDSCEEHNIPVKLLYKRVSDNEYSLFDFDFDFEHNFITGLPGTGQFYEPFKRFTESLGEGKENDDFELNITYSKPEKEDSINTLYLLMLN